MDKKKKTIIIIVVVVAVAAIVAWKKGLFGKKAEGGVTGGSTAPPDTAELGYILSHVQFNDAERKKIESYKQAAQASEVTRQGILADANAKGYSYDQMLVLKALWVLYHQKDKDKWDSDRGWKMQQAVLQLDGKSLW